MAEPQMPDPSDHPKVRRWRALYELGTILCGMPDVDSAHIGYHDSALLILDGELIPSDQLKSSGVSRRRRRCSTHPTHSITPYVSARSPAAAAHTSSRSMYCSQVPPHTGPCGTDGHPLPRRSRFGFGHGQTFIPQSMHGVGGTHNRNGCRRRRISRPAWRLRRKPLTARRTSARGQPRRLPRR